MNANLQGMKNFYKGKRIPYGIIVCDDGTPLTGKQAESLIDYCLLQGYKDLHSMPDFKEIECLQKLK